MRISRTTLKRCWAWSTLAGLGVAVVLGGLDLRLKALSGVGTADLQDYASATAFDAAFHYWGAHAWLARAGFNMGLDYLFMPLYAASFFFSGILVREHFAPRPGLPRRLLGIAAMVPLVGAGLDAVENGLELAMLWNRPDDATAHLAFTVSSAKWVAVYVGLALLAGAVIAQLLTWRKRPQRAENPALDR